MDDQLTEDKIFSNIYNRADIISRLPEAESAIISVLVFF